MTHTKDMYVIAVDLEIAERLKKRNGTLSGVHHVGSDSESSYYVANRIGLFHLATHLNAEESIAAKPVDSDEARRLVPSALVENVNRYVESLDKK